MGRQTAGGVTTVLTMFMSGIFRDAEAHAGRYLVARPKRGHSVPYVSSSYTSTVVVAVRPL